MTTRAGRPLATLACVVLAATVAGCNRDATQAASSSPSPRAGATGATSSPTSTTGTGPRCKIPAEIAMPTWVPEDLPFPEGTYAYKELPPASGYRRALFVLGAGTVDFARFLLSQWPAQGWSLGRGDAEPGEIEEDFRKGASVGALKANDIFCAPGYTVMYFIYAPDGPTLPSPSYQGTPLQPSTSP